jgi:hypothetical protein
MVVRDSDNACTGDGFTVDGIPQNWIDKNPGFTAVLLSPTELEEWKVRRADPDFNYMRPGEAYKYSFNPTTRSWDTFADPREEMELQQGGNPVSFPNDRLTVQVGATAPTIDIVYVGGAAYAGDGIREMRRVGGRIQQFGLNFTSQQATVTISTATPCEYLITSNYHFKVSNPITVLVYLLNELRPAGA